MLLHRLIPFFVLTLDLLLLGSALAAGGRSERNRRFVYLTLGLSVWNLGVLGLRWTEAPSTALFWERFLHLGVVAIPILFYHYVWSLLGQTNHRRSLLAGYGLAALFAVAVPTAAFMPGVRLTSWGFAPVTGPLYVAFLVYFIGYIVLGLVVLARAYGSIGSTFLRNRVRLVMIGAGVGLLGGIVDFGRFAFDAEWLYPAGIPASAVFALALGVAIVRYRLMNVGQLAKRVLLYTVTWALVAPLLLVVVGLADGVLPPLDISGSGGSVPVVLVLVSVLMLALPLMRKLEDVLNTLMFQRRRATADALVVLNKQLSEIVDLDALGPAVTAGLADRIAVAEAAFYVRAPDADRFTVLSRTVTTDGVDATSPLEIPVDVALWLRLMRKPLIVDDVGCQATLHAPEPRIIEALDRARIALVVPVFLADELAAILVIGEKLSGAVFDPDEIELLEVLAGHVAHALKNARLYADLKGQMEELRTTREADRAKEHFLAILAHELRNPLAPILNAAHVLQRVVGGEPKTQRLLGIIERQGEQLSRLVDDLLDVSRIQLGKIRLASEPLDVRRLVGQCLETVRASGKGHGRELRASLVDTPVVVTADPARLEQVFWNLLDNALKYSPADTPITVTVERVADTVVVTVADLGVGIPPEVLPRVFDLFAQADLSLNRSRGGLGLGLALVRSLVEQHGGTVTASSAGSGQGSAFTVRLPLAGDVAERPERAAVTSPAASARKVLLVEDDADARESLGDVLTLLGHRVEYASDGAGAIDTALAWSPDVCLIDIGLPDMDGYEVARRLRASPLGHMVSLIAVTGYGQPEDRQRALASGFDAHLVKPVKEADLSLAIAGGLRSGA